MEYENLKNQLESYNQAHLLEFWPSLNEDERNHLRACIDDIDFDEVTAYFKKSVENIDVAHQKLDNIMEPLSQEQYGSVSRTDPSTLKNYNDEGLKHIGEGKVATLLLAGGQGTRLGVGHPKGMYDVGLPSHRSLFQIQAERIRCLEDLAEKLTGKNGKITWYIMTSFATKQQTIQYFKDNNHFGLNEENVIVFQQGMLPCFANDGKIILEKPSKISSAPDGNGGLYRALKKHKLVEDLESRGIKYIHVYGVDNILVKVADPVFLGYCSLKDADCGAKVVEKSFPTEAVGVICKVKNKYQVVEYSEITLNTAQKRNQDGRLTFGAGNICNHFFTTDFLRVAIADFELPHHIAKKKIPYANKDGLTVKPEKPNGMKLEKFVFDVFELSKKFVAWEVLREDEFSPLKNADGTEKDNPTTCRNSIYALHQRYVIQAGGVFVDDNGEEIPLISCDGLKQNGTTNGGHVNGTNGSSQKSDLMYKLPVVCEISPLVSYAGEGLEEYVLDKKLSLPFLLNKKCETTNAVSCHSNDINESSH